MLSSEHAVYEVEAGLIHPDRLTRGRHADYVAHAERMLAVYRGGAGRTRRELHREVEGILADEPDCPARRVRAFARLLDDAAEYDTDRRGRAARLRLEVFALAAPHHPLVERVSGLFDVAEERVKTTIAEQLGRPWPEIERELYADVLSEHRLRAFPGYPDGPALLARYNVAQAQACLYRALSLTVVATADFKTILRYAKLARLLHEIRALGPARYRIHLTGPLAVLHASRRYGVNLARFLPALLACAGWEMEATIATPWGGRARLLLSAEDGLHSHLPPPEEFDSSVEAGFAAKFGPEREGWRLEREAEVLWQDQTAFVPDFVFRRADGTTALLEIVGFWTPEYLAHKRETIRRFRDRRILLAVAERSLKENATIPEGVLVYKTALKVEPVLAALARFA